MTDTQEHPIPERGDPRDRFTPRLESLTLRRGETRSKLHADLGSVLTDHSLLPGRIYELRDGLVVARQELKPSSKRTKCMRVDLPPPPPAGVPFRIAVDQLASLRKRLQQFDDPADQPTPPWIDLHAGNVEFPLPSSQLRRLWRELDRLRAEGVSVTPAEPDVAGWLLRTGRELWRGLEHKMPQMVDRDSMPTGGE